MPSLREALVRWRVASLCRAVVLGIGRDGMLCELTERLRERGQGHGRLHEV